MMAGGSSSFSPLVVVELASDTKQEAVAWLLSRIRDKQQNGGLGAASVDPTSVVLCVGQTSNSCVCARAGAELLVEQLGPGLDAQEKENPHMFIVGASWQRLISGAEDVGLFKEFSDGSMRGFTCANKHNFKDFQGKVKDECERPCC